MLNMSLDRPKGKLNTLTVSLIKQITGGDLISTEQKYEKIKEIRTNMRFLFGSNFPVTLPKEDDDDAFWERMIIIPFLYSIDKGEADPNILSKLMQEKDGIVTQCLLAFNEILTNAIISVSVSASKIQKLRPTSFDVLELCGECGTGKVFKGLTKSFPGKMDCLSWNQKTHSLSKLKALRHG